MSTPATTQQTGGAVPAAAAAAAPAQPEILPQTTTLIHAARLAIQYDKPIQMDYYVDTAINKAFLGEDADTTAAITGQLAGALYGASDIPGPWLERLAWRARIEGMADALIGTALES